MALREARALYDGLPSRARVVCELARRGPCPVVIASTTFGRVEVTVAALERLDLDGLFSGRWRGEAVEAAVMAALREAAATADATAPSVVFEVCFGRLGVVALHAHATEGGVRIDVR